MRKKYLRVGSVLIVFGLAFAAIAVGVGSQREAAKSPVANQQRPKKLREIAMERDVEIPGRAAHAEYADFEALAKDAEAVVYGRIIEAKSYFDESGHPIEHGTIITTEYAVEVLRILKDKTREIVLPPNRPGPALLTTPLKIARNGGVVYVNGHRASVKVKGFDEVKPGKQYVFFLFWSSAYNAYYPAGGNSGVVVVNDDLNLHSLASSEEMQSKIRGMNLEALANRITGE